MCVSEYADGCVNLANSYANGFGTAQDVNLALSYLKKACGLKNEDGCKFAAQLEERMKELNK